MSSAIENRIAALKAKKEALDERLGALEQKAKSVARKRETRRKIVVGGTVLAAIERDAGLKAIIRDLLARSVTRGIDRDTIADLLPVAPAPSAAPNAPAGDGMAR